jgi:hypothetical protein
MKTLQTFIYCGVGAVIFGAFCIWGALQLYDAIRSYSWPHVSGTIISSVARSKMMRGRYGGEFLAHWPDVRYEYVVGGRHFVSDRIMFAHRGFSKSGTQRLVDAYPVNKIVVVYFDPKDPQSAVLEPGVQWLLILALAFAIFLTVLMVLIVYADLRGQLPFQQPHPLYATSPEHATVQTHRYQGAILFFVAMGFALMFFIVLLPDASLWPMIITITFAVSVFLYLFFR